MIYPGKKRFRTFFVRALPVLVPFGGFVVYAIVQERGGVVFGLTFTMWLCLCALGVGGLCAGLMAWIVFGATTRSRRRA